MTRPPRRHAGVLLDALPISDRAKSDLVRRMAEPTRHYHTMDHCELLWSRHLQYGADEGLRGGALETLIALAIAYHDSVYVGGAADNEARSADVWLEVSAAGGFPEADRFWIADTIRATANHLDARAKVDRSSGHGHARQWVLDLDLTPLGESPEAFDDNMVHLAAELPHLSVADRHASLIDALMHFATVRPLYACRRLAEAFEEPAQKNLRRHLSETIVAPPRDAS